MQIVIDIPEERYKHIQEEQWLPNRLLIEKAIANGIPLDNMLDKIRAEIEKHTDGNNHCDEYLDGYNNGMKDALEIIDKYREGEL